MYLTVDDNKRAGLWDLKPSYFRESGRWGALGAALMNSAQYPNLLKIACYLGLKPGAAGILNVEMFLTVAKA